MSFLTCINEIIITFDEISFLLIGTFQTSTVTCSSDALKGHKHSPESIRHRAGHVSHCHCSVIRVYAASYSTYCRAAGGCICPEGLWAGSVVFHLCCTSWLYAGLRSEATRCQVQSVRSAPAGSGSTVQLPAPNSSSSHRSCWRTAAVVRTAGRKKYSQSERLEPWTEGCHSEQ